MFSLSLFFPLILLIISTSYLSYNSAQSKVFLLSFDIGLGIGYKLIYFYKNTDPKGTDLAELVLQTQHISSILHYKHIYKETWRGHNYG